MAAKNKKTNPFPDFKAKEKRETIGRLVNVSKANFRNPVFWSREMKLIGELLDLYPNPDFFRNLNLKFKLNSLAWFKTEDGACKIRDSWNMFNYKPPEEKEIVLEEITGESIIDKVPEKKKTMMEFLNG